MLFILSLSTFLTSQSFVTAAPVETDVAPVKNALIFRWPSPSDATVTQTRTANGKTMVATYHLHYVLNGDGSSDVVLTDPTIVTIDGKPPDEQTRPALASIGALLIPPDMRIPAGGQHPELLHESKYYDDLLKVISIRHHGADDSTIKNLINSPDLRKSFNDKLTEPWNVWVSSWIHRDRSPNAFAKFNERLPVFNEEIDFITTYTTKQLATDDRELLHVQLDLHAADPKKAASELFEAMSGLIGQIKPDETGANAQRQLKEAIGKSHFEVTIEMGSEADIQPTSLLPCRATDKHIVKAVADGKEVATKIEIDSYAFDWIGFTCPAIEQTSPERP